MYLFFNLQLFSSELASEVVSQAALSEDFLPDVSVIQDLTEETLDAFPGTETLSDVPQAFASFPIAQSKALLL